MNVKRNPGLRNVGTGSFIIGCFLILILILTVISAPVVSVEFGKAYLTSAFKVGRWCVKEVIVIINQVQESNVTKQVQGGVIPLNETGG
jgi:hypothetical protein